jgi:hypothetical protein
MTGARGNDDLRPRCGRHGGARAGWVCSGCGTRLCPECAATRSAGPTSSNTVCVLCGEAATRLVAPRWQLRPFSERLLSAPAWPLTKSVLASLVALAAFRAFLSYRGFAGIGATAAVAGASIGAFWAYVFYIIRHTATGQRGLGVPEFRDLKEDLFAPATKGGAATAVIWVPAVLYLLASNDWDFMALDSPDKFKDPVIWLLLVLGIGYCPMALVAAATDIELGGMLNPVQIIRYIVKAGRNYAVTVMAIVLMAIPGAIIEMVVEPALRALPIPFVCRWLAEAAGLYVPFVMARMLGTLLYVHGDALDWGSTSDYEDPVLPDAKPRGTAPPPRTRKSQPVAPLEPPMPSAGPVMAMAIEDSVPTVIATEVAAGDGEVTGQDLARAMSLYEANARLDPHQLTPDQHFAVGHAAANEGRFPLAVRALKAAAFSTHAIAPRAMIALARVYREGMHDPDSAASLFHEAVKRYPGTPVAAFAHEQLQTL